MVVFHVVDANWVLNVDWSEALAGSSRRYTLVVLMAAGSLQYDTAEELCSMTTVNCMRHRDVVAVTCNVRQQINGLPAGMLGVTRNAGSQRR